MKIAKSHNILFVVIGILFLFPDFACAADLQTMVSKITNWLSTGLKAIGTIIIIAVGIYFMKNLDRWKEIFLTCIGIIAATLIIMNADTIANTFFSN
ncbi:hypothetical protein LS71_008430 [Helicobacter jaachi]|uniref:VirB2 type IV secretion protein n=1 Tax=Helicobacter jaachi TaxID=1677920 RepID=A0A4U8T759_9HELI|nr:TrbC/VirB2 family protein [Helicobacter jaachi]TLD95421.1 hypothetical protein LS71_008430 [Helicobacter jaachi]